MVILLGFFHLFTWIIEGHLYVSIHAYQTLMQLCLHTCIQISAIKSVRAEQARAVTPDNADDLPRLSINSFTQLGFDVSVTFIDARGMKYQYFDLIKDGYSVDIKDPCRIDFRKDRYLQTVTCQE